MFDIPDHIVTGTSCRRVIRQVNSHRIGNIRIIQDIRAGIPVINIITGSREDCIVACSRIDRHRPGIIRDRVGLCRSDKMLDFIEGVGTFTGNRATFIRDRRRNRRR